MTAELVAMNKSAIALAADSAVTITTTVEDKDTGAKNEVTKVYNSVNKLFQFSRCAPVGIMTFGNASFMGVPWETIIKVFREELKDQRYDTLKEYSSQFLKFFHGRPEIFTEQQQIDYVGEAAAHYIFHEFFKEFIDDIEGLESSGSKQELQSKMVSRLNECIAYLRKYDFLDGIGEDELEKIGSLYGELFKSIAEEALQEHGLLSSEISSLIHEICCLLFCKKIFYPSYSGIVVAGFGDKEIFPSLEELHFEGVVNNRLKHGRRSSAINFKKTARIIPFAQENVARSFMQGIDPAWIAYLENYVEGLLGEYPEIIKKEIEGLPNDIKDKILQAFSSAGKEIQQKFVEGVRKYMKEQHLDPLYSATAVLPIDELALLAESLVSLTNFKQRFSIQTETVGGPIDVAIITKGDGFIWIKRKEQFNVKR